MDSSSSALGIRVAASIADVACQRTRRPQLVLPVRPPSAPIRSSGSCSATSRTLLLLVLTGLPEAGWTNNSGHYEGRLAEKLMAERCSLEAESIGHLSAINLSARQKEIRMNFQLCRCSRLVSPGAGNGELLRLAGSGQTEFRAAAVYPCVVDFDGDGLFALPSRPVRQISTWRSGP